MAEDKLIVALTADIKDLRSKLNEANKQINDFGDKATNSADKAATSYRGLESQLGSLVIAYAGLIAAQVSLSTAFNNSLKLDALKGSFEAIFGSAEAGEIALERLRAKSEELGVEFSSLAGAYKLFAGATTQSGMSIEQTNKIFDSVAKTSAVLKLSAEDTEGALRALAQMMGKGTVQAEELRGQLGERVPGAFKLAANAMGVTEQELGKMLESGQVMAKDLLPKLATELDKAFGSKVTGNITGMTAEWNRFKNSIFDSTSTFNQLFAIIIKGFNDVFSQLGTDIKRFLKPEQYKADEVLKDLSGAINKITKEGQLKNLVSELKTIQNTLQQGSPMWKAYGKAILEAENRIKDFNKVEVKPPKAISLSNKIDFKMPSMQEQALRADVDISALQEATQSISDFQAQTNLLNSNLTDLAVIGGKSFATIQIPLDQLKAKTEEINETMTALSSTIAVGLTGAFEQAMLGSESFGQAFAKMIKQLIARLLAAVAAALALAAVIAIATGGASLTASLGKLGIKGGFGGLLNLTSGGLLGGASQRVVSPVGAGALGQGSVEFNIMGDKLYGVLKNYESRLDRLQ